jgi:hypothetical protein
MSSTPWSKISTTDDNPRHDFERNVFNPRTPFRAFSMGEETKALDLRSG